MTVAFLYMIKSEASIIFQRMGIGGTITRREIPEIEGFCSDRKESESDEKADAWVNKISGVHIPVRRKVPD